MIWKRKPFWNYLRSSRPHCRVRDTVLPNPRRTSLSEKITPVNIPQEILQLHDFFFLFRSKRFLIPPLPYFVVQPPTFFLSHNHLLLVLFLLSCPFFLLLFFLLFYSLLSSLFSTFFLLFLLFTRLLLLSSLPPPFSSPSCF